MLERAAAPPFQKKVGAGSGGAACGGARRLQPGRWTGFITAARSHRPPLIDEAFMRAGFGVCNNNTLLRVQGKPAMTRSVLQREEAAAEGGSKEDEEDELAAYLARIDATFGRE